MLLSLPPTHNHYTTTIKLTLNIFIFILFLLHDSFFDNSKNTSTTNAPTLQQSGLAAKSAYHKNTEQMRRSNIKVTSLFTSHTSLPQSPFSTQVDPFFHLCMQSQSLRTSFEHFRFLIKERKFTLNYFNHNLTVYFVASI